jgi:predicted membrane protein
VKYWIPETEYRVVGERGQLMVRQRRGRGLFFGNRRNDWDLRLTGTLPVDLDVKLGAGESRLDLKGVDLASLEVNMGVGELNLDLTGPRTRDLEVRIHGGVGSARITLPRDVGVRVEVDGGIGSVSARGLLKDGRRYTNEAFGRTAAGRTAAAIRVEVEAGIGSIELREE